MSFEHAAVSKACLVHLAIASFTVGILDVKHFCHLQLVPHISKYHQYWRLIASHLAFGASSDLLIALILLYNVAIPVERRFGSIKFASFLVASFLVATILEFASLLLFHKAGVNHMVPGPLAVTFSVLYQYWRILPAAYRFRIFGIPFSDKSFHYLLAAQLACTHGLSSLAPSLVGILTGQIYRSDLASLKSYRISPAIVRFSTQYLAPVFGPSRSPRRRNRVFPEPASTNSSTFLPSELFGSGAGTQAEDNRTGNDASRQEEEQNTSPPDEDQASDQGVETNRENRPRAARPDGSHDPTPPAGSSMVREWVDQLTGRAERASSGMRIPSEVEVTQLVSMFPDIPRETIVGALQRRCAVAFYPLYLAAHDLTGPSLTTILSSPTTEAAVEILLTSQT